MPPTEKHNPSFGNGDGTLGREGVLGPCRPSFPNLGRRKAYEEVADEMRRQIFARQLTVNHRLPTERDLAEQFGVSRMVVREAIRSLERAGLLTVKKGPRGGIFVARAYERPVTDSIVNLLAGGGARLEDLFEVRALIEPYCAARAAEISSENDVRALARLVEPTEGEDARSLRERNLEFHKQMIRMSGNPVLTIVGEAVLTILNDRIRSLTSPDTSRAALGMHKDIFCAIEERKPTVACALVAKDISVTGSRFAALSPEARVSMAAEPADSM